MKENKLIWDTQKNIEAAGKLAQKREEHEREISENKSKKWRP